MNDPTPLPVKWDGTPVTWTAWESQREACPVFICPPPRPQPCPECGLIRPRVTARGTRTPPDVGTYGPLTAFRCTHCGHDQVTDIDTGQTWDLDMTDYGPDGSWPVESGACQ